MSLDRRSLLAVAAWVACTGSTAGTEPLPVLIARAKRSVVLVGSYGLMDSPRFGFRGSGFVVADGRHVVTNVHVLPPETPGRIDRSVAIQFWTPETDWVMRSAKLVASDSTRDLAILKIDEGVPIPPLRLAAGDAREGTSIALMGFPLGGALGYAHVTHRGIVASRAAITPPAAGPQGLSERAVRQLRQGAFDILQLDVTAYPGNSGGPVLDADTGEVIGVVNMVLVKGNRESALSAPSGISYAIPVSNVTALLATLKFSAN